MQFPLINGYNIVLFWVIESNLCYSEFMLFAIICRHSSRALAQIGCKVLQAFGSDVKAENRS